MDRFAILETHGRRCGICGQPILGELFDIDHIVPRHLGGLDDDSNLQPAHRVCNRSKSTNEAPSWKIVRSAKDHRPGGAVYDQMIGIPNYVVGCRENKGNSFVPIEKTIDRGKRIRAADAMEVDALASHGAYLTDEFGVVQRIGEHATYVIWPHVAMRHPRYNQNIDSGLDRAIAQDKLGFVMTGSSTHPKRLTMIEKAARHFLVPISG